MMRVQTSGLSVRFGRVQALDRVDLSFASGAATMLVGPNGAGKTTILKVLLGLVRPDAGTIEVDGRAIALDNDWKRRVGYLPEAVAFSESLTGQQLLRFFARARGVPRARTDDVLETVGLSDARRRAIRGYSRGMRQRLGLAVAMLAEPEVLILDEPTVGLDREGLSVLWSLIARWREAGRMVLVSSHDLALMERRVDEICVLREGRILARGTAEDLRRAARLPHCVWLDVAPDEPAKVELLCAAMTKWGKGRVAREDDRIRVEVPPDALLELMEIQSGFSGTVRALRVEEPTLDVVYDRILGAA